MKKAQILWAELRFVLEADSGSYGLTQGSLFTQRSTSKIMVVQQSPGQYPKFNYAEALQKSYLFYEAQRAGDLPEDNRIPWRVDSTPNDGKDVGRDLSKGYFDAGDHVKYGLPMASTMTMLAWGVSEFGDAYEKIGQLDESLDAIKWGVDYILNAYDDNGTAATADDVFYGQVANGFTDHSYWGPPETMTMERPIYQIDAANPGSDLAGQAASALASASIIFRSTDAAYADKLLAQAQKLYAFAETYRGKYSDSITKADAGNFYESFNSYTDELAFGAMWLHKATKAAGQTDPQYLNKAEQYRQELEDANFIPPNNEGLTQNWFNNTPAVDVMLAQETGDPKHKARAEKWLDSWMPNTSQGSFVEYTDGGFAWTYKWGALRHTANAAMLAGIYANNVNDKDGAYSQFVERQINYMLGDNPNNRSYVVGFGENSPQNPHHRGAHGSTTDDIANPTETQNVLYGALVGGPSAPDDNAWKDDRTDYIANEVALDYNAGYSGALAFLVDKYGGAPLPDSEIPKLFDPNASPPTPNPTPDPNPVDPNPEPTLNYAEALQKSYLFYEAQRSGDLPEDNRIPWRGDSALTDGSDVGRDLTGGYYTSASHVKFGFPTASAMTMLAWGVNAFEDGYKQVGQHDEALDAIRWGTDYILKAYDDKGTESTADDVFYGHVGDEKTSNAFWGAPEAMPMARPAYKIDAQNPGSDLAGESAATLASASISFRSTDPAYADKLLTQAKKLYAFAETYQGKYSDSITDAYNSYRSYGGYIDELAWGAVWLHKATKAAGEIDPQYLTKAEQYFKETGGIATESWTHDWDGKTYGTAILLAQETGDSEYQNQVESWLDRWLVDKSEGGIPEYSEGGLAWMFGWGALRYTANTAMLASIYADKVNDKDGQYSTFAQQQINYMLGDNPNHRSYMIGFGENYPQNPNHRGAHGSTTNTIQEGDTKNILYGALVGGPTAPNDNAWEDNRENIQGNEPTLDFNAGLTGALAYLAEKYGGTPLPDSEIPKLFDESAAPTLVSSEIDFSVINAWQGGVQGEIAITNQGNRQINGWTLSFEYSGEITQLWKAEMVSHTGNTYVIRDAGYDAEIAPTDTISFGFIAKGASSSEPSGFDLNGQVMGAPVPAPFSEPTGKYDVRVGDFDEKDGLAQLAVEQNQHTLDDLTLNQPLGGNVPASTLEPLEVASGLRMNADDILSLKGFEQGVASKAENPRMDYIEFGSSSELIPSALEANTHSASVL